MQASIDSLKAEATRLIETLECGQPMEKQIMFTLKEIVTYCKECVSWEDAKAIVMMLYKLLRNIATAADNEMVDSIETEFKNRKEGNTYQHSTVYQSGVVHDDRSIQLMVEGQLAEPRKELLG